MTVVSIRGDKMKFNKHVVYGKVAVLISTGYGAGWSTWASNGEEVAVLFDELIDNSIDNGMFPNIFNTWYED